ncbi:hypothetical protein AgCh_035203 [Apium graveolens]
MTLRLGGRLFQQFIVDAFSTIEQARLWWFRTHQTTLRNELYNHIADVFREGDRDSENIGKSVIHPAGFVGSRRYMQQNFQDALTVCLHVGHPDRFLTMTCNPTCAEILEMMKLIPNGNPHDSPDIIARVFRLKLQQLVDDIKKKSYFGTCLGAEAAYRIFGFEVHHRSISVECLSYHLPEINTMLRSIGKSLKDFPQLPQPPAEYLEHGFTNLILEETSYVREAMLAEFNVLYSSCNLEPKEIFEAIMNSVENHQGGVFFAYGSGGCGKTYLWRTLICKLQFEGKIVLPVASSGIAATLLPDGCTAHSHFKIPIMLDEHSFCNIGHDNDIAYLLRSTKSDKSIDIKFANMPFGGITVIFGGDFRQILPVINYGSRSDIAGACITRSKLWKLGNVFILKQNMRLNSGTSDEENEILKNFAAWCEVISGSFVGTRHFIPRMEWVPSDSKLPFKLIRKQMPLQVCYAMTINKSQGQSLDRVGLFLPKSVFTHGQLYVAISRVTSPGGLKFFIDDESGECTTFTQNVVFKEDPEEGEIYKVSNFVVKEYIGDEFNRCVRNEKHIYFSEFTTLVKDYEDGLKIPEYSFDLRKLVDTDKLDSDKRYLCDVIDVLNGKHSKYEYTSENNEKKHQVKFTLTDGSCLRNVTFFDKFAKYVDAQLNAQQDESIVIIIASAKVNKYEDLEDIETVGFKKIEEIIRMNKSWKGEPLEGNLPSSIRVLEGNEYTVTLSLREENLIGASMVYEACVICKGYEAIGDSKVNIDVEAYSEENVNIAGISCISGEESSRISLGMCSPLREERNGQITAKKRSKLGIFPVWSCAPAQ